MKPIGRFLGSYSLYPLPDKPYLFLYIPNDSDPLTYIPSMGLPFCLDRPFETDLATIPHWLWWHRWLNPLAWIPAALIHDYLWEIHIENRSLVGFYKSNEILQECCRTLGVPEFYCWAVKWGCGRFGKSLWLKGESKWQSGLRQELQPVSGAVQLKPNR